MDVVVVDEDYEPMVSSLHELPSSHEYLQSPVLYSKRARFDLGEERTSRSEMEERTSRSEMEERTSRGEKQGRSSVCVDLLDESQISKHGHDHQDHCKFNTAKKSRFGSRLARYARSIRGSISSTSLREGKFTRLTLGRSGHLARETEDIEKDMKRLFKTKRKLELGYITFCSLTTLIGLVAMTLYEHIHFAMYGIWFACFLADVVIVSLSLLYGNVQLNRIEEKYPNRNVKEEWAAILKHELGH